jgi:hypothetical protein
MRRYEFPANIGDYRPTRVGALLGLTALSVVLAGVGLVALVAFWPEASGAGRGLLAVLEIALLVPAVGLAAFSWLDLAERGDRRRWLRVTVERLEIALDADLDGDGSIGRASELPRVIPVQGARLVHDHEVGQAHEAALGRLLKLVDQAGRVGLSRRQLLPRVNGDREFYDWSMHVLESLGLLRGRGRRVAGVLTHDVKTTKAAVLSAWGIGAMSKGNGGNGGRPGV